MRFIALVITIFGFFLCFQFGRKFERENHPIMTMSIPHDIMYADFKNLQVYFHESDDIFNFDDKKQMIDFIEGATAEANIEVLNDEKSYLKTL